MLNSCVRVQVLVGEVIQLASAVWLSRGVRLRSMSVAPVYDPDALVSSAQKPLRAMAVKSPCPAVGLRTVRLVAPVSNQKPEDYYSLCLAFLSNVCPHNAQRLDKVRVGIDSVDIYILYKDFYLRKNATNY